jgi:DNA-binding HxlR family transcriptional regulator
VNLPYHYQERTWEENQTTVLWYILLPQQLDDFAGDPPTFTELKEATRHLFGQVTLSKHLKALLAQGLIDKDYEAKNNRWVYVIANKKQALLNMLETFIERERIARKDTVELEQAASQLVKALKPFGKLPKKIEKTIERMEEEYEKAVQAAYEKSIEAAYEKSREAWKATHR